jgi:hypothetical protein
MAEEDYSSFLGPDAQLAQLWKSYYTDKTITEDEYNKGSNKRMQEISDAAGGVSLGIGSEGYVTPNYAYSDDSGPQYASRLAAQEKMRAALANKATLTSSGTPGVYQKQYYDASGNVAGAGDIRYGKSNDPALRGTERYDPNATGSTRSFYDASGKQLTAAQAANTEAGKGFAAAGWDIGYGPGMIGPGVKADTSEREARIASRSTITQESYDVDPTPLMPSLIQASVSNTPPPPPAKTAPIDTVLFNDDLVPIEVMTDLIFEDIGGQELISIARNDIVNGQQISYSPIKNLTSIQQQYNPNNIVSLQSTSDKYFANFAIKLDDKIPNVGNGPNGSNVYIEESTGDLIIETINTASDEQLDIQIVISGTIYEADI